MVRPGVLIVVMALMSATALAQRGPCAGDGPNPLFRFYPGNPDHLYFQNAASLYLGPPTLAIAGNDITVVQFIPEVAPPPGYVPPPCNSQLVPLGVLPPGTYNVQWHYQPALTFIYTDTFTFSFIVPAVTPAMSWPALLALMVACAGIGVAMLRR